MHPTTTRTEFLRLRAQGLSLSAIARRLGVSKPTLIKWNRENQPEIASLAAAAQQRVTTELTDSTTQQIADLTRKLNTLKQELFSRAMRDISTPHLEAMAGILRQRLESLKSTIKYPESPIHESANPTLQNSITPPPQSPAPSEPIRA